MEMMKCPHCGAQNSVKRDYCFQCDGALRGEPRKQPTEYIPTCANCSNAAIFPPPGQRLARDQVWCMKQELALPSSKIADDCFVQAFGWNREEILD
jgi:hypothetical protein